MRINTYSHDDDGDWPCALDLTPKIWVDIEREFQILRIPAKQLQEKRWANTKPITHAAEHGG